MKLTVLILIAGVAFAQTTRYPGSLDSDSSMFVVSDNIQTTLNTAMAIPDTTAVVASSAGFVANMIATICDTTTNTGKCTAWEHMLVTAVAGNVLTVTRGFAGTSPRTHSSGRLVSVLIDSAHQKVLKDAVVAIETALGPNFSMSAGLVTAGAFTFSPYSCNGSAVCAPGGATGMNLIAGNNTLTMTPVPSGVNGSDTGHALYVSGGTGTAEACTITGGSGTSGQASGTIIINCGNTHSGAWTLQTASGGLQEAICSLASSGGQVAATASITLRGNVTNCGKTSVYVNKWAGSVISGAFTILGTAPVTFPAAVAPDAESFLYGGTTEVCPSCPGGTPRPINFPITFQSGTAPLTYQQLDAAVLIGRGTSDSIGVTSGLSRDTLSVHTEYNGVTGTAVGIQSIMLLTGNTGGLGSASIAGYVTGRTGTTSTLIGVHGECRVEWAATVGGGCIGVNAEGYYSVGGGAGTVGLIGLNSNMNINSPAGANVTVLGAQIQMNNANANMSINSVGVQIVANSGTIPKGLYVQDGNGSFTNPVVINTTRNPSTSITLWSSATGTNDAPNSIGFYRGPLLAAANQVAAIQADHQNGGFGNGILHMKANSGATLVDVATFDFAKNLNLFGHLAQNPGNSDVAGAVTLTASTAQSVTFSTAYTAQPACVITPLTNLGTTTYWVTVTTAAMTVHTSTAASASFYYHCTGNPN